MVKVGDKKRFTPEGFSGHTQVTGTVVWVHPQGRFYTVKVVCNGYTIMESFSMHGSD